MSALIYVIDDEPSITQALKFSLQQAGYVVEVFHTGQAAVSALSTDKPSLLILDVGLPDGSGFDFFRQYRALSLAPVIFLTARDDEIDRVVGLEMGADDYIGKPFSVRELVARVGVVLRRVSTTAQEPAAHSNPAGGPFRVDTMRKRIHFCNSALTLTAHEYRLLAALIAQPGRVFDRAQLLQRGWDAPEHRLERTIDTHIKGIRTKLRAINASRDPIKTHRGMGYSFEPDQ